MAVAAAGIDENYLNERIMKLNLERKHIHDIAAKYGIKNLPKVPELQLIRRADGNAFGVDAPPGEERLKAIEDPRDRMKEYNREVNARRRKIHAKQAVKRKEQDELEAELMAVAAAKKSKAVDRDAAAIQSTDNGESDARPLALTAGEETDRPHATAVIAAADGKVLSHKKVNRKMQDFDENAADDEDNEVRLGSDERESERDARPNRMSRESDAEDNDDDKSEKDDEDEEKESAGDGDGDEDEDQDDEPDEPDDDGDEDDDEGSGEDDDDDDDDDEDD